MKYRQLADTGVFVSELCLGTMTFGGTGQIWEMIGGLDQSAADAIVHRSLDAGINFVDTANVYATGQSETMLGKALAGKRHGVIVATKVRGRMGPGAERRRPVAPAHHRERRGEPEAARHRLHRPLSDSSVGHADQHRGYAARARRSGARGQGALHRLLESAGVVPDEGARQSRASSISSDSARTQSYYSLVGRELERDIDSADQGSGPRPAGVEPAGRRIPLRKVHREAVATSRRGARNSISRPWTRKKASTSSTCWSGSRRRREVSPAQIALAWILANDAVSSVIIGARKMPQLDDNLKAIDITLTVEEMTALDEVSRLPLPYPAWMEVLGSDRKPGESRY